MGLRTVHTCACARGPPECLRRPEAPRLRGQQNSAKLVCFPAAESAELFFSSFLACSCNQHFFSTVIARCLGLNEIGFKIAAKKPFIREFISLHSLRPICSLGTFCSGASNEMISSYLRGRSAYRVVQNGITAILIKCKQEGMESLPDKRNSDSDARTASLGLLEQRHRICTYALLLPGGVSRALAWHPLRRQKSPLTKDSEPIAQS